MNISFHHDFVFKAIFGDEKNKAILIHLLNAILNYEADASIVDLDLKNPFSFKEAEDAKTIVMDIRAKDGTGRLYNIEMQIAPPPEYVNRTIYYLTKLLGSELKEGEGYDKLPKSISISIISDGLIFPQRDSMQNTFRLKEINDNFELSDLIELHYIELDKFHKLEPEKPKTRFEKWLCVLKYGDIYNEQAIYPEWINEEKEYEMAMTEYKRISSDEQFRIQLEMMDKYKRDIITSLSVARKEGVHDGIQIGMKDGIQMGIKDGAEKKNKENAKKMLQKNLPIEMISEITGLSIEEINKLVN